MCPKGAARPLHGPSAQPRLHPSAALLGPSAPAHTLYRPLIRQAFFKQMLAWPAVKATMEARGLKASAALPVLKTAIDLEVPGESKEVEHEEHREQRDEEP